MTATAAATTQRDRPVRAGALRTAIAVEAWKTTRATPPRTAAAAVVLGASGLSVGFLAAARADVDGPLAAKIAPMVQGTGWPALLGLVGQLLSVGLLLATGVVVAWCYGREFTDGTFGALFATPTPRRDVALAKAVVAVTWGLVVVAAVLVATVVLGLATGLGPPGPGAWGAAGRTAVVGVLTVALALPLALVASVLRGYLAGIGALIGLVVVTQVVTLFGAGGWFPWAAPGMWAGMGGPELAATVTPVQLALAVPVGALGVGLTAWWWQRAEVV